MVRMTRSKATENQSFHALAENSWSKRKAADGTRSAAKKVCTEESLHASEIPSEEIPGFDNTFNDETNCNEEATDELNKYR